MDLNTAKNLVGKMGAVVESTTSDIWGKLEYVTKDGWAGVRGPHGLDEERVERLELTTT